MLRRSVVALAVVALAACEFPTEPPKWDQTWQVPGERITVSVGELLPADVGLNADSTAFVTDVPGTSTSFSLGDVCSECAVLDGQTAPKPEFRDTLDLTWSLPADLVSATVAGGTLDATLAHNLSFDPLRPSSDPADPRGHIVIRVTSSGNLVAYDSIDGADTAFPGGTALTPSLELQPVQVSNDLNVAVEVYSPQGDSVTIDTSDTVGVSVATSTVEISEATVSASSITIDPVTTTLDLGEVDSTTVERILGGSILFDVDNPFSVSGSLDVAFQGSFPTVERTLPVNQGVYSDSVAFSGEEMRSILGADTVDVVASGSVSADGGTITVTPTQELVIGSDFRLTILIGSTEGS